MQLKKQIFLLSASAVSASARHLLDFRFDDAPARQLFGQLTTGGEVNIYYNFYNASGELILHHLEATISVGSSSVFTTATSSFNYPIVGPVEEIEVVKANSSGGVTVLGII